MTQRVELATVMDRFAVDGLVTEYAVAVDDGDWEAYRRLFAPDGRTKLPLAGGIEGGADEVAGWLARSMELFPMRRRLIVNRRLRSGRWTRKRATRPGCQADYINPMRFAGHDGGSTAPDFVCGGRYAFELVRTDLGWRLREVVVQEKWRRAPSRAGNPPPPDRTRRPQAARVHPDRKALTGGPLSEIVADAHTGGIPGEGSPL